MSIGHSSTVHWINFVAVAQSDKSLPILEENNAIINSIFMVILIEQRIYSLIYSCVAEQIVCLNNGKLKGMSLREMEYLSANRLRGFCSPFCLETNHQLHPNRLKQWSPFYSLSWKMKCNSFCLFILSLFVSNESWAYASMHHPSTWSMINPMIVQWFTIDRWMHGCQDRWMVRNHFTTKIKVTTFFLLLFLFSLSIK